MITFIIKLKHQSIFGVGEVQTSNPKFLIRLQEILPVKIKYHEAYAIHSNPISYLYIYI